MLLKEEFNDEMNMLANYLMKGKHDRWDELAENFHYLFDTFIEKYPSIAKKEENPSAFWEMSGISQDKFKRWLVIELNKVRKGVSNSHEVYPEYLPSWMFLKPISEFSNQWIVHETYDALGVANNGFKAGMSDYSKLGLTTKFPDEYKERGGYNFGYLIKDAFKEWNKRKHFKYGNELVIAKVDGIRCWHNTDKEHQAIFWGSSATNIIPIITANRKYVPILDGKEICGETYPIDAVKCLIKALMKKS